MYQQEAPFCVDVELTEGCNLRCDFCGIQAIREGTGDYKCMTPAWAEKIAASIAAAGWNSRIEFSGHGEPTMNPDFIKIIGIFRKHLPRNQILLTSNGGGLLKDPTGMITALFEAGLNILALDNYDHVNIVPKLLSRFSVPRDVTLVYYPQDGLEWSPHTRRPRNTKLVVVVQDISAADEGNHSHINNRAGQGAPPSEKAYGKRCVKPFRDIVIRWNGKVNSCCNDYRGVIKVGDATKTPVAELWNGEVFNALRHALYAGNRDFEPCRGCDFVGFRTGLLPDKLGKQELPPPTAEHMEILRKAGAGKTYTPVVWREWEGKKKK